MMRDSSYMNSDLIQRLRDSADGLKSCDECNGECIGTCIFTEAADAIEELLAAVLDREEQIGRLQDTVSYRDIQIKKLVSEKTVPHWISVEDRLPDDFSRVLGFMAWGGMMLLERQSKGWYLADRIQQAPDEAVLYWMPLPEPPKEDTE